MEQRPADYSYWDTVEHFTLTEAAWLWCDIEPPDAGLEHMPVLGKGIKPHPKIKELPAKGHRAAMAMWQSATESETANRLIFLTNYPDTRYLFPRRNLRVWAERHGYQPLFLFPELRPEKQSGLSLDGALAVIDALARMAHKTWDSDKRAYGLIPRIQQAGCNLDRKQIGKYLNEVKKIKKIG